MASLILFPIQFQRQSASPIDVDSVFQTTVARLDYLNSPRRYAGQIVSDLELNKAFMLNAASSDWVELNTAGQDLSTLSFPTLGSPVVRKSESISMFFTAKNLNTNYPDFLTKNGQLVDAGSAINGITLPAGYCAFVTAQVLITTSDTGRKLYKTGQLAFTVLPTTHAAPDNVSIIALSSTVQSESEYMSGVSIAAYAFGNQFWPTITSTTSIGSDGENLQLAARAQVEVVYQYIGPPQPYINRVADTGVDFHFEIFEATPNSQLSYSLDSSTPVDMLIDGIGQGVIPVLGLSAGSHVATFVFSDTSTTLELNFMT